ncbi:Pentatricopeptide repeat-containing protein [Cynara cardunculus var. scolymus]|uniref:Pentatricopeptide repeat-containing protein n=1 Tax=Cynara cardunculus var. scolymus TaxID=59895 RepID=A0A103YN05_CYNCS|nr:Pentatricopeptide repeat-containing protein [Cynara cardunculus var. scolymus]
MHRKVTLFSDVLIKHGFYPVSFQFIRQLASSPFLRELPTNLQTLCSNGHLNYALTDMAKLGLQMNFLAYDTLLNECVKQKSIRGGQRVHAHMIKTQYRPPLYLGTRLLVLYNKCDCLWDARQVFDEMPDRNVVSWTAMMSAYSKKGYASQVLNLLVVMLRSGTEPNEYTFATVLTCCTGVCGLEHGKQVHNLIIKNNFESHLFVGCSLLDMYAKAGRIHEARSVFEDLPERDVVSCTAIISGYAQLGLDEDALELFRSFQREGMASNYVTYASVLTAVSGLAAYEMGKQIHSHVLRSELPHGEMENRGLEVFDEMMSGKDGVVPDIEHYGCVVDLLGRAGQVEKAYEFIKQMPLEPNAAIWGSLLGACLVHSNVDIGEIVGHRLLEIEPENSGNYVILSNLFASRGRWDDVRTIRSLMKEKAVAKDPGKSWIEVDQTLHTFHAGDRLHPKMEEVHDKMNELSIKVKENGYSPDLSRVLYDVDDEQKEKILLGHSEKLALAFGLISSPEGKPIRIMKNLRVCVDCHSFAKVVSQICQREVFMRDKNRFHHIVGGVCSCGDYW